MVAKPDVPGSSAAPDKPGPATAPDEEQLERDLLSLPIRLEFGPVLEALAEAGYVGERLNEWLIDFNRANKDTIGKLELDAEGRLLVSTYAEQIGFAIEFDIRRRIVQLDSGVRRSRPTARGWASSCPTAPATLPTRPGCPRSSLADYAASGRTWLVRFCPHFVAEVMSRNDRPSAARRKMEEYIANGGRLGWLIDPFRRQAHIYRPGAEPVTLDDPEQLTGDPELPGFVFNVRALIFDAQ